MRAFIIRGFGVEEDFTDSWIDFDQVALVNAARNDRL